MGITSLSPLKSIHRRREHPIPILSMVQITCKMLWGEDGPSWWKRNKHVDWMVLILLDFCLFAFWIFLSSYFPVACAFPSARLFNILWEKIMQNESISIKTPQEPPICVSFWKVKSSLWLLGYVYHVIDPFYPSIFLQPELFSEFETWILEEFWDDKICSQHYF